MKQVTLLAVLIIVNTWASTSVAGPFGLSMGMRTAELRAIDPEMVDAGRGMYKLTKVPRPHSAFEYYIVQVCPSLGLSWMKAVGRDISTSGYGLELRSAFDDMSKKLTAAYGASKTTDVLLPGSIWDEPDDFMMALLKKERYLMTTWDTSSGARLDSTMTSVGLVACANGTDSGYIIVEYYFATSDACDEEMAAQEDGALR